MSRIVNYNNMIVSNSGNTLMEQHPEWKSDIRVVLFSWYLRNLSLCEQSYTMLEQWINDHHTNQCVFAYEGLSKLQGFFLQVCSDFYNQTNYSLCAVVLSS